MALEEGDLVLCTVERIENTIVFVKISFEGKEVDGSITTSEIAPGRIRNLRDYVVPKKKIVCKVLSVSGSGNAELSLRRVSSKEKKEVMEKYQQEMAFFSMLKKILGEKSEEAIEKIKKESSVYAFFGEIRENPENLEKLVGKKDGEKILEILNTQKQKKAVIKKEILLKTELPNGISLIKLILSSGDAEIKYVAAGRYSIKTESTDLKKADRKMRETVEKIEKKAKENRIEFSVK